MASKEELKAKFDALLSDMESQGLDPGTVLQNFIGTSSNPKGEPPIETISAKSVSGEEDMPEFVVTGKELVPVKRKARGGSKLVGGSSKKAKVSASATPRKSTRLSKLREEPVLEEVDESDEVQEIVDPSPRSIVGELIYSKSFMEENYLGEVLTLLEKQGWGHLFQEEVSVNTDLIRKFYATLKVKDEDGILMASFIINDEPQIFTSQKLARWLKVPHSGFARYIKGTWPSDIAKDVVVKRVGTDSTMMSVAGRVVHRLLVQNVIPRLQKHGELHFQDYLLMDQILQEEQINLAAQIIHHMKHSSSSASHGLPFPGIVKIILQNMNEYNEESEEVVSKEFDTENCRKLGFTFIEEVGWRKIDDIKVKKELVAGTVCEGGHEKLGRIKDSVSGIMAAAAETIDNAELLLKKAMEMAKDQLRILKGKLLQLNSDLEKDDKDVSPSA